MAGKPQKAPDQLVNTRGGRGRQLTVLGSRRDVPPPPCPPDMQVKVQRLWDVVWNSRVATRWDEETDLPQIEHLFWCIDERDRARRSFRRKRFETGAGGQVVMSPLAQWIPKLDRMRLGLTFMEGKSKAQELMDSFEDDDRDDEDGVLIIR